MYGVFFNKQEFIEVYIYLPSQHCCNKNKKLLKVSGIDRYET